MFINSLCVSGSLLCVVCAMSLWEVIVGFNWDFITTPFHVERGS